MAEGVETPQQREFLCAAGCDLDSRLPVFVPALVPDRRVISTGPGPIVRHPMYSGALVILFGTRIMEGLLGFVAMIFIIFVATAR